MGKVVYLLKLFINCFLPLHCQHTPIIIFKLQARQDWEILYTSLRFHILIVLLHLGWLLDDSVCCFSPTEHFSDDGDEFSQTELHGDLHHQLQVEVRWD